MAESEVLEEEQAADAPEKKKGKKKLFIIVGVVVVVVLGLFFFLFGGGGGEEGEETAVTTTTEPGVGSVIEGDQLTVNLADQDATRYARVTFAVVVPVGADSAAVGAKITLLKDEAITIVAGYTAAELLGTGGLDQLRSQLTDAALEIWPDGDVMRVVLAEVLVQ